VTDADLLDVFRGTSDPVLSTAEVADSVPIKRRGVLSRLRSLEADGDLDSKQIGGRNTVWWVIGESDEKRRESDPVGSVGDRSDSVDRREDAAEAGGSDRALDEALSDLDTTDERREAVRACVEYLRKHGEGQKSDFVDAVYPDHPARYESAGGWWNTIGKEYLKAVAEGYDPLTPPPKEGSHTWRFDP